MDLELIKYQGKYNYAAALLHDRNEDDYYFWFAKIYPPELLAGRDDEHDIKLTTLYKTIVELRLKTRPHGKRDTLYYLIKIKETEFDSMYKLLECVWENE